MTDGLDGLMVILDSGSGVLKAGFRAYEYPIGRLPSIIGKPDRYPVFMVGMGNFPYYVGDHALSFRGILTLTYPLERGIITNEEEMYQVWADGLQRELNLYPPEHGVLFAEPPLNPPENREKMFKIMFERLQVASVVIGNQSVFALAAAGIKTGVVVDSGHGVTSIVPIVDGVPISNAIRRLDIAGRDITQFLFKVLREKGQKGYSFSTSAEETITQDIKEKLAYFALDFEKELEVSHSVFTLFTMPDGKQLPIGNERFRCTEILFRPSLIGSRSLGIHRLILDSINSCPLSLQKDLFRNILLVGGTTLCQGFEARLKKELSTLLAATSTCSCSPSTPSSSSSMDFQIIVPPADLRTIFVWMGAQRFSANEQNLRKFAMTRADFEARCYLLPR